MAISVENISDENAMGTSSLKRTAIDRETTETKEYREVEKHM